MNESVFKLIDLFYDFSLSFSAVSKEFDQYLSKDFIEIYGKLDSVRFLLKKFLIDNGADVGDFL